MNSPEIDKKTPQKWRDRSVSTQIISGLRTGAQSIIAFDHVILEFWKTDKVFHFCCRLSVGHIRLRIRPHNKLINLQTISYGGNAKDYCTITTRKSENKSATCVVLKTILQNARI